MLLISAIYPGVEKKAGGCLRGAEARLRLAREQFQDQFLGLGADLPPDLGRRDAQAKGQERLDFPRVSLRRKTILPNFNGSCQNLAKIQISKILMRVTQRVEDFLRICKTNIC